MRIVGGRLKGIRFNPPKNLPVRPTTDMAKEALFNILDSKYDIESLNVLDLFSGTGNISLEFASRGALTITSVDQNFACYSYLRTVASEQKLEQIKAKKADAFKFLKQETQQYDLIFADPPFDSSRIPDIAPLVFERDLLRPDGILIIEHPSMQDLSAHPKFSSKRKYGYAAFSFFNN